MRGRSAAIAHAGSRAGSSQASGLPATRRSSRPPLRLIDERSAAEQRRAARPRLLLRAGIVISALMVFAAVASHVILVQSQFRLESHEREAKDEEARYERLRLEVARLASPERVVAEATGRLNMKVPTEVEFLNAPEVDGTAPSPPAKRPVAGEAGGGWSEVKPYLAARF